MSDSLTSSRQPSPLIAIVGLAPTQLRAHILGMPEGWYVTTTRPDPKGGPDLQSRFLVRVADQKTAIALVNRKYPDAIVTADQKATAEQFEKYDVKPGTMLHLWERK
jgi:hypothetical protein